MSSDPPCFVQNCGKTPVFSDLQVDFDDKAVIFLPQSFSMGASLSQAPTQQVTKLLADWRNGDQHALEALTPLVYEELRKLAAHYMRREHVGHTLQSTALVHEAYIRLVDQQSPWKSRAHFFGIAAQMMRRILVDHAKAAATAKRGAGMPKVSLDTPLAISERPPDLIALDDALKQLAQMDAVRSQIVELRFFGGLSNEETAEVLEFRPPLCKGNGPVHAPGCFMN